MALGSGEKYWGGSVVTDDYGRLILVSEGDEVGELAEGEKYWAGSHATDDYGRLIVVGPGGASIGGGGLGLNVKTYGAKGDGTTDDTAAIEAAAKALPGEKGVLFLPDGSYLVKAQAGGSLNLGDGLVLQGESRQNTKLITKHAPGATARIFEVSAGRVEFRDMTIEGPAAFAAGDEVSAIGCDKTANIHVYCENVLFRRLHCGMRGYSGIYQTFELERCEIDGDEIGLSSGEAQEACFGILTGSIGPVIARNSVFRNGGSNTGVGVNHNHQLYLTHDTPMWISNCQFYNHIDGRYVQFNGNAEGSPAAPAFAVYDNCYFGKMKVEAPAIETSERVTTLVNDCIFDTDYRAITVKGDTVISGATLFRGGKEGHGYSIALYEKACKLTIGPEVIFSGNMEGHITNEGEGGHTLDLRLNGCTFEGPAKWMVVFLGTGNRCRSRGVTWNGEASTVYIDVAGTLAELLIYDNDFGGSATQAVWLESGSTVTELVTRNNNFHAGGTAIRKNGTITTETSKGNVGYADV